MSPPGFLCINRFVRDIDDFIAGIVGDITKDQVYHSAGGLKVQMHASRVIAEPVTAAGLGEDSYHNIIAFRDSPVDNVARGGIDVPGYGEYGGAGCAMRPVRGAITLTIGALWRDVSWYIESSDSNHGDLMKMIG